MTPALKSADFTQIVNNARPTARWSKTDRVPEQPMPRKKPTDVKRAIAELAALNHQVEALRYDADAFTHDAVNEVLLDVKRLIAKRIMELLELPT